MTLNIKVGENHLITSDKRNIILNRKVEKYNKPGKAGKPTGEFGWKEEGYYPTIERALNALLDERINTSEALSLVEVIQVVQTHREEIEGLLVEFKTIGKAGVNVE